jgi:hypothetical protein
MEQSRPGSIVVVHGVGDQTKGQDVGLLTGAIARHLGMRLGSGGARLVLPAGDEIICRVVGPDVEMPEAFSLPARNVEWKTAPEGPTGSISLYEFFWADLSKSSPGIFGDVRRGWQLLTGLPRIGYPCLQLPETGAAAGWLSLLRGAYILTWLLLIVRMILALGYLTVQVYYDFHLVALPYYDALFLADLAVAGSCMVLLAAAGGYALSRTARCRREGTYRPLRVVLTGLSVLGLTATLTQTVPLAILDLTGTDKIAHKQKSWIAFRRVRMLPDDAVREMEKSRSPYYQDPIGCNRFYQAHTWTGAAPYLLSGMVVVWSVAVMGVLYAGLALQPRFSADATLGLLPGDRKKADRVGRWMDRVATLSAGFWGAVGLSALFAFPLLFLAQAAQISLLHEMPARLYIARSEYQTGYDRFVQKLLIFYVYDLAYLLFLLLWGAAAWPWMRATVKPVLELTNDVTGYFPRVEGVDQVASLRVLLGGLPVEGPILIEQRLTDRLRAALTQIHRTHGGPVILVTHSLGTVISAKALDHWNGPVEVADDGDGCKHGRGDFAINWITMGSPLKTLSNLYPHLYGDERGRGEGWSLPTVHRWYNLYHGGDLVGRDLLFGDLRLGPGADVRNAVLGDGGHGGYFSDDLVAGLVLDWYGVPGPAALAVSC